MGAVGIAVVDGGPMTTVQDLPGRIGYWHVGVPPSGPMDDLSHRLVNRVVGNPDGAAALELTRSGPTLQFDDDALVAVGGAEMPITVDGRPASSWSPLAVRAGATVRVGATTGAGMRATLAVAGGIDADAYLGSRSTFTLGAFGGHHGRTLRAGDRLTAGMSVATGAPAPLPPGLAPVIGHSWEIGVLVGPHADVDFITRDGLDQLLRASWEVHFNSARTGVRLVGPRPRWARADGGEAGLHPSNIHDTGYAIGAVDLTGDLPVILGPDGPSLGGFVCPAVVAAAERWKLGQLAPGDRVRLVAWTPEDAAAADHSQRAWVARATVPVEPIARPSWNQAVGAVRDPARRVDRAWADGGILDRREPDGGHPGVTYRRAGDRFLLVEYGPMTLDLALRVRVHLLEQWVNEHIDGVVDVTAGVRSVLVQLDVDRRTVDGTWREIAAAEDALADIDHSALPSRVVHLPLSWDDPATREAIERYMHGVRPDAPWCPWNIEFIRRINGLASVDEVHRIVFDASYLVLGLGDVYLGAPVATPLDPRHRLVTTKYNPARTWTPENAVGIGGAYLCIYGMEGPGGYQFVGRTVQVWNRDALGPHFEQPWLLRQFDQLRFHPVSAAELLDQRAEQHHGRLDIATEPSVFRLGEHRAMLAAHDTEIARFRATQQDAFRAEREAWARAGEFELVP
jgi:urea carboxylase